MYMDQEFLKDKLILVVDDEADLREIIISELEFAGAKSLEASNIADAEKIIDQNPIDLVITDIRMPGGTGIELLDNIKSKKSGSPPFILITGFADIDSREALDRGAEELIQKPFALDDLLTLANFHLSPILDRYHWMERKLPLKQIHFTETFENALKDQKIKLGRGGLSFFQLKESGLMQVGVHQILELMFTDKKLRMVCECKWIQMESHSLGYTCGFKILNLDEETQGILNKYWKSDFVEDLRPFIPKL